MLMLQILFFIILSIAHKLDSFRINKTSFRINHLQLDALSDPSSPKKSYIKTTTKFMKNAVLANVLVGMSKIQKAAAIGNIYELAGQDMAFNDISFNVQNTEVESTFFQSLFQNDCKTIRTFNTPTENTAVLSFGADSFQKPPNYRPGVSSFLEDGGHATLTLKSQKPVDGVVEIFQPGNGLEFIKVGNEVIRLSKAIQAGGKVKFAYGWVDIDSPSTIPLEVVVGISKDPIMLCAIRVSNIEESLKFFKEQLGMERYPFPLARQVGSDFEAPIPKEAVYISYGRNSMGLLLLPVPKQTPKTVPLSIGSQLNGFTIVVNDKIDSVDKLPKAGRDLIEGKGKEMIIKSPDGYNFVLKPLSTFETYSTKFVNL